MPDPVCAHPTSVFLVAVVITASLVDLASPQSILVPSPAQDDGKGANGQRPTAKTGDIEGFFNWPLGGDSGGATTTRHGDEGTKDKRGYKAEGDAYIRFGKRSQEMEESLVQYDVSLKYQKHFFHVVRYYAQPF